MYQNGTYGDELCIRSLTDILKVNILVFTPQYGTLSFESTNSDNNHSARIAYNGINHYDAVIYRHSPIMSNHRYFSFRDKEVDSSYTPQASSDQADKMMEKHTTDALEPLPGTQQSQPLSGSPDPELPSNADLTILSANITSWEPHSEYLLACGADILVMQETRLSLTGINNHTNRLSKRQQPWASVWGKPPGQIKVKHRFAKSSTGSSCHGGVGILTRNPIPLVETGINSQSGRILHESARWCTAAIPMGPVGALSRRFIHLINFYGIANHGNGAKHTQNERLLKALFEHASALGNQPVYICMDGNTNVESSATLQQALSTSKWFDLAVSFSSGNPDMTFCASKTWDKISTGKGVTRPDYVLANAAAMAICTGFSVRRDLPTKGHLGLQFTIKRELCMLLHKVYTPPTPFRVDQAASSTPDEKAKQFQDLFLQVQNEFERSITKKDTNTAWQIIAKTGEKFLQALCQTTTKNQFGRHKPPRFTTKPVASHASSKTNPNDPQGCKLTRWTKTLHRISELKFKQHRYNTQSASPTDIKEAGTMFAKITPIAKKFSIFSTPHGILPTLIHLPK